MTRPRRRLLALSLALCLAPPAFAVEPPQQAAHDRQPKDLAAVEVRATPLSDTAESIALPVYVLAGRDEGYVPFYPDYPAEVVAGKRPK